MAYLADTNVLLRGVQSGDPHHTVARAAVETLLARGETLYLATQNLVEFWVVATRPEMRNGLGMTPAEAEGELSKLEGQFSILPDTPGVYAEWRRLVTARAAVGIRAYDARLAAVMLVHGVTHILTFNVDDFRGYAGIDVVHPSDVRLLTS